MQNLQMGNKMSYLAKPSKETVYDDGTVVNCPVRFFAYGAASMQGWRRKQEDKFTCLAKLCKDYSFFGVYDGHGGSEISEYLQENFHLEIKHFLECENDVETALYLSFLSADSTLKEPEIIAELNAKLDTENLGMSSEKRKKLMSHAMLLKDLRRKTKNADNLMESDNTETQDAEDLTATNAISSSQNPNDASLKKESNADGANQDSYASGLAPQNSNLPVSTSHDSSADNAISQDSSAVDPQDSSAVDPQDSSAVDPQDSSAVDPQDSSVTNLAQDTNVPSSAKCSGTAVSMVDSCIADSTQDTNAPVSVEDSNTTTSSHEMGAAGPSQEYGSSTEEEVEMDDESTEEETADDTMGEMETNEIDQPLKYLLNEELESSDSEDEDFDCDDEETESEGSDKESESTASAAKITAEEFANIQPGDLSGSTATVLLLNENMMHVANIGDSRCVLSRKGEAIDMSVDHKPTDAEELERIVVNGGTVHMGRINNIIDMSRAIGDFKLKNSSLIPSEQCVTAEPTIKSIPITMDDEFLVIASDGIWNSMTSQEVVDYINMRLKHPDCDLRDVCYELFELILSPDLENDGSGCDNMSCVIIKFIQRGVRFTEPQEAMPDFYIVSPRIVPQFF